MGTNAQDETWNLNARIKAVFTCKKLRGHTVLWSLFGPNVTLKVRPLSLLRSCQVSVPVFSRCFEERTLGRLRDLELEEFLNTADSLDLNPPADEALLKKVEANIGMKLPESFREAYLEHNGEVEGSGGYASQTSTNRALLFFPSFIQRQHTL